MNKTMIGIIMGIMALMLMTACVPQVIVNNTDQANKLTVTGTSELDVQPDEAELNFAIETNDTDAKKAQSQNADITSAVMAALKAAGVQQDELETTGYQLYQQRDWIGDETVKGVIIPQYRDYYKASNTIKLTSKNLDKLGTYIDLAVQAGANRVDNIVFTLSKPKQGAVKQQALSEASRIAKEKAQALADGTGVSLGKLSSVSENSYNFYPVNRYFGAEAASAKDMGAAVPTPITPGTVNVQASVSVSYKIA